MMRKRRSGFVVIICCICLSTIIFAPLHKVFAFTETRIDHPIVRYIPFVAVADFRMRYTHSIHKSDVLEYYRCVEEKRIQLLAMEYEDLAIGMPSYAEVNQTLTLQDGKYYLQFDKEIIDNFTIYIGDLDLDLVFIYQNHEYDLKKNLQRGKSYLFEVKRLSLYEQWKGVRLK